METIVFLSGFALPKFISKSSWFFEDSFWQGYNRVYYQSKTPTSDEMVEKELINLTKLVNSYPDVLVVGHSLGAWWASNLACCPQAHIKKLALWTPLGVANMFPIFNVTEDSEPAKKIPNLHNVGPDKTFVAYGEYDLIVPPIWHAIPLANKFQAMSISLNGGHAWQSNHKEALIIMKDWFKLDC